MYTPEQIDSDLDLFFPIEQKVQTHTPCTVHDDLSTLSCKADTYRRKENNNNTK